VVVEVLIAQRLGIDPLAQQLGQLMLEEVRIPMVLKASGQTTHKPIRAVHPSQEHDATVAGNPITGEVDGDDFCGEVGEQEGLVRRCRSRVRR
jgi:hypothetical protein